MDNQELAQQALIAAYRDARERDPQARIEVLRGANLAGQDLSGLDLSVADLSNADLSYCTLHGTNLSGAVTEGTLFSGILVGDLLATGLPPSVILNTRYQVRETRSAGDILVFAPEATMTTQSAGSLSDAECQHLCASLSTVCWENLNNRSLVPVLYPDVPWRDWMINFAIEDKRAILDWAAYHWKTLDEIFYSVPALEVWDIDVTEISDGIATDPWKVVLRSAWHRAKAKDENAPDYERNRHYPPSPWGDAPEITQIRNSVEARYEEIFLPSGALAYFERYTFYLERGILLLYHIGPPLPGGSTALLSSSGRVWRHETANYEKATDREQQLLNEWLATFDVGGKAYRWSVYLPRKVWSKLQILEHLRRAGIARVVWHIDKFADDLQCTVLACYSEEGKQVPMPQPLDDVDFWCMTIENWGIFELLVQEESIRPLNEFPKLFADRWDWTE